MAERVPPGRAGRLWIIVRLDAARRGRELLDRKRQLLRREGRRLTLLAEERTAAWNAAAREAATWALRAALLGGAHELAIVAGPVAGRARVEVAWRNTMGVSHPDRAACELPELTPPEVVAANAAYGPAADAHRRALQAAVDAAVVNDARRRIATELAATQRRLRGIERHRIPALDEALRTLALRLDELEREERVVTRWAQRHVAEAGRR